MSYRIKCGAVECRFQNLHELFTYYRSYLPGARIERIILEAGRNFVSRTFGTPEQERLQFIRRCLSHLEADARQMAGDYGRSALLEHTMVPS